MTATVVHTPAPATVPVEHSAPWRAVFALARFEARRLLLSIPVVIAFVLYFAWILWRTPQSWDGFPALQDADRATQEGPLLVGVAVLLAADFAVIRSVRHGTESHFAVLVLAPWRRTVAHVLAVVPAALLTAVAVAGQFTWQALKPGAVGHGSPAELAVGPLAVLLLGAAGVLMARLVPSALGGPLLAVGFLFVFGAGGFPFGGEGAQWLAPVVSEPSYNTLPSDLIARPAAWHALYLAGVALCLACLAVLAAGRRTLPVLAGVVVTLLLAVAGGVGQTREVPAEVIAARERFSLTPEKEQTCVERGRSRYCAFPEWVPRTADWAAVADRVQSRAGGSAHDRPLVVRQRIEASYGLEGDAALAPLTRPGEVTVGTAWGGNRVPEFSSTVAAVLVAGNEKAGGEICDGRMVTIMWLSLNWQDDPLGALRRVRLDDSLSGSAIVLSQTNPLTMTEGQTDVVRRLLERPGTADRVAAKVKAHWAELTAPGVTTARAAQLLGVPGPKKADSCE